MTPPVRPSMATKAAESVGTSLRSILVGLMLFCPGLYWFVDEIQSARLPGDQIHSLHISIAVGLMVAGGIAIQPPFGKQLTAIYITVFPNGLPLIGGRRETDPAAPTSNPEVKP